MVTNPFQNDGESSAKPKPQAEEDILSPKQESNSDENTAEALRAVFFADRSNPTSSDNDALAYAGWDEQPPERTNRGRVADALHRRQKPEGGDSDGGAVPMQKDRDKRRPLLGRDRKDLPSDETDPALAPKVREVAVENSSAIRKFTLPPGFERISDPDMDERWQAFVKPGSTATIVHYNGKKTPSFAAMDQRSASAMLNILDPRNPNSRRDPDTNKLIPCTAEEVEAFENSLMPGIFGDTGPDGLNVRSLHVIELNGKRVFVMQSKFDITNPETTAEEEYKNYTMFWLEKNAKGEHFPAYISYGARADEYSQNLKDVMGSMQNNLKWKMFEKRTK